MEFIKNFAARIRELFPNTPRGRETTIAEHACIKYSGRVGRSAAAKELQPAAIRLAVIAHIRHTETRYDEFLADGMERGEARIAVQDAIASVLNKWEGPQ